MFMFKKKSKKDSKENQVDPEIAEIMGPLPEEAMPRMNADTDKPEIDIQQKINQVLESPETEGDARGNGSDDFKDGDKRDRESADETADEKTDQAVKDIIARESDDLLKVEDEKKDNPNKVQSGHLSKIKRLFNAWWNNKLLRNISILIIVVAILAVALIPVSRYSVLNAVGVRASTSLSVIDSKSGKPIKDVEITIAGVASKTGKDGKAVISGIKLGKTELVLKKRSFTPKQQSIVVGWGSNPFIDPFQLNPVGTQYSFTITDWLSNKPIEKAEVTDGDSVAVAGKDGKATLIIEPKEDSIKLKIKAEGYREETIQIGSNDKIDKSIKLTPSRPDVFVSRRSGRYDLYKRDADGKNETVLLVGTGSEQEDISILVHPTANIAAFVSSREGKRNKEGYLLSNLYIVDLNAKTVSKVEATESEKIQLIDWIGDKLVFVKVAAGPSGATASRQRIVTFDYKQEKQAEPASSNYFNDVEVFNQKIYYAPGSSGVANAAAQLFKINPDGSSKTSLINKETWVMFRSNYNTLQISAVNNLWYELNISDAKITSLPGSPASPTHRIYIDSSDTNSSLWVDNRDGKGVLILQDLKANTEKVLYSKGGLGYPIRWLNSKNVLFRITNSQETADYVLNIDGGNPVKVSDVTSTSSTNRWYYYR
jgi:hypothetical protein